MIKTIIFDFDGVLVESVEIKTNSFAKLFEKEGSAAVKRIIDYHLRNAGVSRFDKFRYIYKVILKRKLTPDAFRQLCEEFSSLVQEEVIRAPFVKGSLEFLKKYSGKYSCYVISATPQKEIEEIIAARKMKGYFRGIFGAPSKKVKIVKKIIAKGRLLPEEMVYIGDALSDFQAAAANAVNFIARVHGSNGRIFSGIECLRKADLSNLSSDLKLLKLRERQNE